MNEQTLLLSFQQSLTSVKQNIFLLSDEFNNVITFSSDILTSQVTAIALYTELFSERNVDAIAPFKLNLDPSGLILDGKIYKIDYDFGDGNTFSQKYFYTNETNNLLNFPNDVGDPRNYIVSNIYYLTDNVQKDLTINAKIYDLGNIIPTEYIINLNLNTPNLDGEIDGYFKNIHLISTKMFGPDDKILYVFESDEPNYILPAIVKWQEDPKIIQSKIFVDKSPRLFNILLPFQNETNDNPLSTTSINKVAELKPVNNLNDIGNLQAKSIKV